VRAAALRGAATLGNEALSDTIVVYITDEDPKVREEAVKALVRSSRGFERAGDLEELLKPQSESSETVRQAAWRGLLELFPRADINTLTGFADRFKKANQPDRQLAVLRVMAAKEEESGNLEQLAWRRYEMAEVLMPNRPTEAADLYRAALQFSIDNGGAAGTILNRARNVLIAYVRARRFDEAIAFAREMINRNASFEEEVGRIVKQEAQALTDQGQTDAARSLIGAVLRQDPPLLARDRRSRQQLQEQLDSLPASGPAGDG
jgi:tetratricopeptide (TPR) repeat protein